MIASLPDLSPGWPNAAGPLTSAPGAAAEGTGLDFAGLLGAAFAPPESGVAVEREPALTAAPFAPLAFTPSPPPLPTGKIMPDGGAPLPPATLAEVPAATIRAPVAAQTTPADTPPPQPFPAATTAIVAVMPAPADDPADPPSAATTPQPQPEDAAPAAAPQSPDPALLAALVPPAAALAPPPPGSNPARLQRTGPLSSADRAHAPLPARVTLPPAEDAPEGETASAPSSASTPPSTLMPLPAADSAPPPAQPAPTLAVPPPAPATPAPDRIEAPRAPAPQQEAAIAQVGDLREALRSARPEMTVRHGEFGAVNLRLEQSAPDQWRAVLASRDPGFVPAIQAALAERAVTAAGASADSGQFMGQNGSGQSGTSDHRYGASPNGGQTGLSPYMSQSGGQSGGRDGEPAPDHRRPSTAAALAARGQDGEAEGSGSEARGLFA